jgi:hypothetical protein
MLSRLESAHRIIVARVDKCHLPDLGGQPQKKPPANEPAARFFSLPEAGCDDVFQPHRAIGEQRLVERSRAVPVVIAPISCVHKLTRRGAQCRLPRGGPS